MHDDLVYDEPPNKTFAPRPIYLENRKRYANGSYSWMATLVPEPVPTSDQYTLSIVVFHRRALTLEPRQELVVSLPDPALYTLAGGVKEVLLQQPPITNELEKANAGLRHIRHGEWIALMQPTGSGGYVDLRWYEVIRADAVEGDLDTTRELTLAGPDWNPRPGPMYAVYVRNVVAVYEKSIKLHAVSAYPG